MPGVDHVERVGRKTGVPSVRLDDLYAVKLSLCDEVGGHCDVHGVAVKANYATTRRDAVIQHLDDPARAAAEIDRTVS